MKKKISSLLAWGFYYLGHFLSIPMDRLKMNFLFRPYTHLMRYSYKIQMWGGAEEPWKES
jgi:hypothetical protein